MKQHLARIALLVRDYDEAIEFDDIQRDYEQYRAAGVHFEETPRQEAFGTGAIFQDLYGNRWELIERKI